MSCSGLGFSSGEGTAAASCRPGRRTGTRCSWRRRRECWTQPPHRSARREPGNHLLWGEERRLPARWSAKPPLGRRLWGIWLTPALPRLLEAKPGRGCGAGLGGICPEPQGDARPGDRAADGGGKLMLSKRGCSGCKLYGRACSEPRHPPRCIEGAADSVRLCCSESPLASERPRESWAKALTARPLGTLSSSD